MKIYHPITLLLLALATTLLLSGCARKDPLLGKWRSSDGSETIEFFAEGTVVVQSSKGTMSGKFRALEKDRIILELNGLGAMGTVILSHRVERDSLSLTDERNGRVTVYQRVAASAASTTAPTSASQAAGAARRDPERAILNNLRQLAAAADQFYLEHATMRATYDQLVGPDKYVKTVPSIEGENYSEMIFEQGKPIVITTPKGRTVRLAGW